MFFGKSKKNMDFIQNLLSVFKELKVNNGFTLVEALVAISILLISIAGPISLAQQSMSSARLAKNQINAFYLAQDAIEFIRGKRDSNILNGNDWLFGLNDCLGGNKCLVDVTTGTISSCGSNCKLIRKDSNNTGLYGYNTSWVETKFRREISIIQVNTTEVYVKVKILWDEGDKNFLIRESLFKLN